MKSMCAKESSNAKIYFSNVSHGLGKNSDNLLSQARSDTQHVDNA